MVPWSELVGLIEPNSPTSKTGRPPFAISTMLRIHFMQQWFGLSDPAKNIAQLLTPVCFEQFVDGEETNFAGDY